MRYNEFLLAGREKDQSMKTRRQNESGLADYIRHELGNDTSALREAKRSTLEHRPFSATHRFAAWFKRLLRPGKVYPALPAKTAAAAAGCQKLQMDENI